jgi:glycosyltransferase involved in cell wall biosynthesis
VQNIITAVIPLYNGAKNIDEALDSALCQQRPADEIVVVDDGSTDDGAGAAIVQEMSLRKSQIRLLHKANGGQGSARNYGIRAARGNLIALLDQDDQWYPEHLSELEAPFLQDSFGQIGWTYANLDRVDETGRIVCRQFIDQLPSKEHPKLSLAGCLAADMAVLPSASLISRDAILSIGGFDEQLRGYEDDDLFLRLFAAGYRNIYINKALSKWRIHSDSASFQNTMARSRELFFEKLQRRYPDNPTSNKTYIRDLVVPRYFDAVLKDRISAMRENDSEAAEIANSHLNKMIPYVDQKSLFIKAILALLSRKRASRMLLAPLYFIWKAKRRLASVSSEIIR